MRWWGLRNANPSVALDTDLVFLRLVIWGASYPVCMEGRVPSRPSEVRRVTLVEMELDLP